MLFVKVIVASNNIGKLREFREILEPRGYSVYSASEVGVDMSVVEETGATFEENAILKAEYVYSVTHESAIADDSGLVLDAFPNVLGVYSARFLGESTGYDVKNNAVLDMYLGVSNRKAKFVSAIAWVTKEGSKVFLGEIEGNIGFEACGNKGFGFDPLFIPNGYQNTFGELGTDVKNKVSHRGVALKKFVNYIEGSEVHEN